MDTDAELTLLARGAYTAYGTARNWVTVGGARMPLWRDLDGSTQNAWLLAVLDVLTTLAAAEPGNRDTLLAAVTD